MIKVKVTTPNPLIPLIRQTPGKKGVWGNCQFFIDTDIKEADWWFVMDGMQKEETVICHPKNTVLVTSESEDMKTYDKKYLNQFGIILTSQRQIKHPKVIHYTQGQSWMIGHMGGKSGVDPKDYHKYFTPYDTLKEIKDFKKEKLLSVFSSGKSRTPGQQLRLDFIEALKKHFGDKLNVFGVYEKYVADKWDGIAPYKYHICLENSHRDDYWTEKLSDAFLGGAYPFYWGAPNIFSYFGKDSLTLLDLSDFGKSIEIIEKVISNGTYEKNLKAIWEARNLVLDKYNIFAIMADLCNKNPDSGREETQITIKPENKKETFPQRVSSILKKHPTIHRIAKKAFRSYRQKIK